METPDQSRTQWRTSSYSSTNGACVEVDPGSGARMLVRDTKNREGPVLAFRPSAWQRFTGRVKSAAS